MKELKGTAMEPYREAEERNDGVHKESGAMGEGQED